MNKQPLKVALITGGTRGIGRGIAHKLAQKNYHLALNYLNDDDSARALERELSSYPITVKLIQAHLGDAESRASLWTTFDQSFDTLDVLVLNAATGVFRELSQLSTNSLRKVCAVNVEGFLEMAKEGCQRMQRREMTSPHSAETRHIIALSSLGAERVIREYGSVALTKAAIEAMVRQLAVECAAFNINVNTIRAGLVDTGILNYLPRKNQIIADAIARTPKGRLTTPEDLGNLVSFLVSNEASMVTGQTLTIDGGSSLPA